MFRDKYHLIDIINFIFFSTEGGGAATVRKNRWFYIRAQHYQYDSKKIANWGEDKLALYSRWFKHRLLPPPLSKFSVLCPEGYEIKTERGPSRDFQTGYTPLPSMMQSFF